MANDPVLSESVIAQSVAPSCSIRNFVSDEAGRVLMVPASSAPLNVSLAASTVNALSSSTSQIGSIANSSFTVGGTVDVGSINNIVFVTPSTQWTVTVSTANTQSVAVSSAIALSSSVLFVGSVVVSSSNTQSVALTSGSLTLGLLSTAQVVTTTTTSTIGLTTTSVVGLTTTSLVALTSSALSIGTVVDSSANAKAVQLTSDSAAIPITQSTLGTVTTVGLTCSNAVVQQVLNANSARKGILIQNTAASATAFLVLASSAVVCSTAAYSIQIAAGASFQYTAPGIFTGGITGCANLLSGSTIRVTELT